MRIRLLCSTVFCLVGCTFLLGACQNEPDLSTAHAPAALLHDPGEVGDPCSYVNPCAAGLFCDYDIWTCQDSCPAGKDYCPGWGCIDLGNQAQHCGACGHECGSEQECVDGTCQDTPCKGFKYCDCGLWVAPEDTCPERSCDPCEEGFHYCGCPSGGCLVNDLTCSPQPDECGNGICRGALRDCGDGILADPAAVCPDGTRLGDEAIEANEDSNVDGSAEAFQYTATSTGAISVLSVYIDNSSTANEVQLGLYSDDADNPDTLLTQGTIQFALSPGWAFASVPSVNVTAGHKYWIAILAPEDHGVVRFRDIDDGSYTSQTSADSDLSTLPATWTTGTIWSTGSASAYASH